jgi:heterodisulfide reductase subunit B
MEACGFMGLELAELEDWNCCGSSSAHALDPELGLSLAARNLALAPPDRPLLIMCPSCFKNILGAQVHLLAHPGQRRSQERKWGAPVSPDLKIVNFLEILRFLERLEKFGGRRRLEVSQGLAGLKAAPYYGCMNMFPPPLRSRRPRAMLMEEHLASLGAEPVTWAHAHRCCGAFLTAARPDVSTPLVNQIMQGALDAGADCLVTACAMCQLNVEIRCDLKAKLPILHFSEVMALALGARGHAGWFARHLVDPRPLLRGKGLIA